MGLKKQSRKTKNNETYACTPRDVKELLYSFDLYVSFGTLGRVFKFDSRDAKHPQIKGEIIASASVHHLLSDVSRILCFYVIKGEAYDKRSQKYFIQTLLPEAKNWMKEIESRPDTAILGALSTEVFLVEWDKEKFYTYTYHY